MQAQSQLVQKTAVRFAKTGPAIYHSHHDMIRFWERMVRRAALPIRLTQGFNPRPRMVFPHALGLGIVSLHEEVELELHSRLPADEMAARLDSACAGALEILGAYNLPPTKKSRQLVASSYRISLWPAAVGAALPAVAADIMARREIIVQRGAPGETRSLDIRPFLQRLVHDAESNALLLDLNHSQAGSARPDEIAKIAAEMTGVDWRDVRLEKIAMVLN